MGVQGEQDWVPILQHRAGAAKGKRASEGEEDLANTPECSQPSPPPQGFLASQVAPAEDTPSLPSARPGGLQEAGTEGRGFPESLLGGLFNEAGAEGRSSLPGQSQRVPRPRLLALDLSI